MSVPQPPASGRSASPAPDARRPRPAHRVSAAIGRYWYPSLCLAAGLGLTSFELVRAAQGATHWDWLLHSGAVVFLIALGAARRIPPAVRATVRRLRLVDVVGRPTGAADRVLGALHRLHRRYARMGAALGVLMMAIIWIWARGTSVVASPLFWLELGAAALAGFVVGGFVAYGRLGWILNELGLHPKVTPSHPDGAAGLRPVGALYLRQALIVSLIGVFAGVWWLLIPFVGYASWRTPYLAIVLICLALEVVALFVPLTAFHRHMVAERSRLLVEVDQAVGLLTESPENGWLTDDPAAAERDRTWSRWQAVDTMPTWPIDARIRRRFTVSNLAMLLPFALQIVNAPQVVLQAAQALTAWSGP